MLKKLFGKAEKPTPEPRPTPQPAFEPLTIKELIPQQLVELKAAGEAMMVVDLRQGWEYQSGHIPNAVNIPMSQLPYKLAEIPKEGKVIMQCYHGFSSLDAAGYLIQNGWPADQIFSLSGGMAGWVQAQGVQSLEK